MEQVWGSKFIGRGEELRQIGRVLDAVRSRESRTLIIGGEAGIGKTRLVARILEQEPSASILSAECIDSSDSPLPFGPIIDALRPLGKKLDSTARTELLEPLRDELVVGTGSRQQLFEMVLSLLEGMADNSPLFFVVEDIHWADRSTRDLLAFLITNMTVDGVAIILTYRSDELVQGHELLRYLSQLQRNRGVVRLNLRRFDSNELAAHLDDLGESPIDHDLMKSIWERSQGNPFYAEELFMSTKRGNYGNLPSNLNDTLLSRLRILVPDTQQVLRVAAVGGMTVDQALLTSVANSMGIDEETVGIALRDSIDHGLLVNDPVSGSLVFRHALFREAAYNDLLPLDRKAAHEYFGKYLSASDRSFVIDGTLSAELARHYFNAGNIQLAFQASLDAASTAEQARGYAEAHIHLERAIELHKKLNVDGSTSGARLVELYERCALVSHLEGDNKRAVELTKSALSASVEADRTELLSAKLGSYLLAMGASEEALQVHSKVASAAPANVEVMCAYAESLQAAARHRDCVRIAGKALEMAVAEEDKLYEARSLNILGTSQVVLGDADLGIANLRKALSLADALKQPTDVAAGYLNLASTLSGPLNRLDDALEVANKGIHRIQELGLERHWGVSLRSIAADTLFRMGRWNDAEDFISEAIARSAKGVAALDLLMARIKVDVGRGRFEAANRDLELARALSVRAIDLRFRVPLDTLTSGLALWQRDIPRAQQAIKSGLEHVQDTDDVWFLAPLIWHGIRTEAECAANARAVLNNTEVQASISRAQELRELSRRTGQSARKGGALRIVVDVYDGMCEGELQRVLGNTAIDVWSNVADSWSKLGQPYPTSYAEWRCAEAILESSARNSQAESHLRRAHEIAVKLRAEPLRRELEKLAQRARIDVIDIREESAEITAFEKLVKQAGLTKREIEVLEMVARGASNREIADACFISESTASVHVSNILTKLNVKSRLQAAALAHRLGLSESK